MLIACLLHTARIRGRDELATMYRKRLATIHKQARDRFETLRESSRAETERLVEVFGDVLATVRESMEISESEAATGEVDESSAVWERTGRGCREGSCHQVPSMMFLLVSSLSSDLRESP